LTWLLTVHVGCAEAGDKGAKEDRIYYADEELGESTAGRVQWKKAHQKGKFNQDPKKLLAWKKRKKLL
jgi:hypothetical protein